MNLKYIIVALFMPLVGSAQLVSMATYQDPNFVTVGASFLAAEEIGYVCMIDSVNNETLQFIEFVESPSPSIVVRNSYPSGTANTLQIGGLTGPQTPNGNFYIGLISQTSSQSSLRYGHMQIMQFTHASQPSMFGQTATIRVDSQAPIFRQWDNFVYYGHQSGLYGIDISQINSPIVVDSVLISSTGPSDHGIEGLDAAFGGLFYTRNGKLYSCAINANGSWTVVDSITGDYHRIWYEPLFQFQLVVEEGTGAQTLYRTFDVDTNFHLTPRFTAPSPGVFEAVGFGGRATQMMVGFGTGSTRPVSTYFMASNTWNHFSDLVPQFEASTLSASGHNILLAGHDAADPASLEWMQMVDYPALRTEIAPQVKLTAYPNPVRDRLIVNTGTAKGGIWKLLRMDGIVVGSGSVSDNMETLEIDVKELPVGAYHFRIESKTGQGNVKFVKAD